MSAPTRKELLAEATRLGIDGGQRMTKAELEAWIAAHSPQPLEPETYGRGKPERVKLERNPATGEWWCPYCPNRRGSNSASVTRCECGARIDGDMVVAP